MLDPDSDFEVLERAFDDFEQGVLEERTDLTFSSTPHSRSIAASVDDFDTGESSSVSILESCILFATVGEFLNVILTIGFFSVDRLDLVLLPTFVLGQDFKTGVFNCTFDDFKDDFDERTGFKFSLMPHNVSTAISVDDFDIRESSSISISKRFFPTTTDERDGGFPLTEPDLDVFERNDLFNKSSVSFELNDFRVDCDNCLASDVLQD